MVEHGATDPARTLAGAVPYLRLMGTVTGGWLTARGAIAAQQHLRERGSDAGFHEAKLVTARFYAEQVLPAAPGLLSAVVRGATVLSFNLDRF